MDSDPSPTRIDPHLEVRERKRGIRPALARRGAPHGSGLGKTRWYVERTLSWLHQYRRLRVRWDRLPEVQRGWMALACSLICLRLLL